MHNKLKILYWNCQGVGNKKAELTNLVQQLKTHVILLNETQLSARSKFKIPNYITYRNDRVTLTGNRATGGTAILVSNKLIHHDVSIQTTSMDNTTIHIMLNDKELRLSAVYKSPSKNLQLSDIEKLLDPSIPTILAGDMNAKHTFWHSHSLNGAGRMLFSHMSQSDYTIIAPTSPTHYPDQQRQRPDVLDIVLMKNVALQFEIDNFNALTSDHNPIQLVLHGRPTISPRPNPKRSTNWKKFATDLHEKVIDPKPDHVKYCRNRCSSRETNSRDTR